MVLLMGSRSLAWVEPKYVPSAGQGPSEILQDLLSAFYALSSPCLFGLSHTH